MKLFIAGGCGEHGRNCFYIKGENSNICIDCGLLAQKSDGIPNLNKEQISSLKYLFLTHSHLDHSGAIPWLYENGFQGKIIASKHTLAQLSFTLKDSIVLEEIAPNRNGNLKNINITWGTSGHCIGSVWYLFEFERKKILFSGDYTENTLLYNCEPIREISADLAVLDCAYGKEEASYSVLTEKLIEATIKLLKKHSILLFPVPKYGRGLEILRLFQNYKLSSNFYADEHFINELNKIEKNNYWYKEFSNNLKNSVSLYTEKETKGIVFISDPQLRSAKAQQIADNIISKNGYGVMTGTSEENSYSYYLINQGKMCLLTYPVHLNHLQYKNLISKNNFLKTIPYHTSDYKTEEIVIF